MGDPHASEIGRIEDGIAALPLRVGTSGGKVTVGCGAITWQLTLDDAEQFAAMFVTACWEAAAQGGGSGG